MIPRLYVTIDLKPGTRFAADERTAHYLKNVMRRAVGDPVILFNGRDGEFNATLADVAKKTVEIEIAALRRPQMGVPDISLCFAPLKKDAVDFLVEKATELGVAAFQPVFTKHTAATRLNLERLAANAIEAAEQTERLTLPQIHEPRSLSDLIDGWDPARRIILCAEAGPALPIAEALSNLKSDVRQTNAWAILCGPEGGFARSELDLLSKLPFVTPVGLGPRILRADTAALAALAVFQSILGDGAHRPPAPLLPIGQSPA
ncbi:16S rRNA (uracil(1498)-N(3))-methyltransferase [Dongia rigui]|uniref:Ribosomal RNA small subunit methyltransferase E n=1 Tax=Dongia rigui TaxID=940149 RepID=A0ABU5DVB4_9PROT|nr:16S rRNA (uracil(1498)-N(3))-methyltransferase [Dongia rigui]MDY0871245.1 16S rRNA (uracil(1498)-N(3))-methyltransferase [Dongia rigui]